MAILNQHGGAMTLSGELNFSRQDAVNTRSELNLHGGTLTTPHNWRVGYNAGSHGRIVKTGGHLEHTGNGVIVGYSSTGTVHGVNASEMRIEGGTMALKTGQGLFFSWAAGTYGYGEFSGGTNDMGNKPITIGRNGGTGFMRMTGGWVTNVSSVVLGNEATSFGRLELSGGVLGLLGGVTSSSTGVDSSTVLLDGGILRHDGSSSQASLINANVQRVALTTNGAVVQLQSYDCTIPAKLVNETGHAGAFTKLGPTRLTLSSPDSAFTGRITVAEGQLRVTGGVYLTGGVVVEDGAGGALDVTGAVDFAAGAGVALTGYVSEELETPVAVLNAAGGIAVAAPLTVSLDGVVRPSLRADLNAEGTTLLVRFQPIGTVLCVR